jgi:hypothetical protein
MRTRQSALAAILVASWGSLLGSAAEANPVEIVSPTLQRTAPCSQPFDAYDYTEAAVEQCGASVAPLTRALSLPGGGTEYLYQMSANLTYGLIDPPAGFDPATATASQLTEYGIPERPTDPTELAAWNHIQITAAPTFLVQGDFDMAANYDSRHWAGLGLVGGGVYENAAASWNEPAYPAPSGPCAPPSGYQSLNAIWSGIGTDAGHTGGPMGLGSQTIGQSGTEHGFTGTGWASHQGWYELYSNFSYAGQQVGGPPVSLPLSPNPGDDVGSTESYLGPTTNFGPGYEGWVWNFSTNNMQVWIALTALGTPVSDVYSGDGAEVVTERPGPGPNGNPEYLAQFGSAASGGGDDTLTINSASINGNPLNVYSAASLLSPITMWQGFDGATPYMGKEVNNTPGDGPGTGSILATASGLTNVEGGFDIFWGGCH